VEKITSQGVILPQTGRLIDVHIGRERTNRAAPRAGVRDDLV
jgi:hypothetical protein